MPTNNPKDQFILNESAKAYQGPSIVDFLKSAGYDSSLSSRTSLGANRNITGTPGSADYNSRLLAALRNESTTPNGSASNVGAMGGSGTTIGGVENTSPVEPVKTPADLAFESYLKAMSPSSETTAAKEFLARSVANSKLAQERALNSGETMGFASGEAQRVNRNNDLTISALKDTYDVLKSADENQGAIAKARYDYETAKATQARQDKKDAAENTKPFKLSQGESQYVWDPTTKTYKIVAAMAPKPSSTGGEKDLTYAQQREVDRGAAVGNIANQFKTIVDSQGYYGVPGDIYNEAVALLQSKYGADGVKELKTALEALGLNVDRNYDGKPDSVPGTVSQLPTL